MIGIKDLYGWRIMPLLAHAHTVARCLYHPTGMQFAVADLYLGLITFFRDQLEAEFVFLMLSEHMCRCHLEGKDTYTEQELNAVDEMPETPKEQSLTDEAIWHLTFAENDFGGPHEIRQEWAPRLVLPDKRGKGRSVERADSL